MRSLVACTLATMLVLVGGCATSLKHSTFTGDAPRLGEALAAAAGPAHIRTATGESVTLYDAQIEGEQVCGRFISATPRVDERRCYARPDIETLTVSGWKDDAGLTTTVYGVMAGCVLLLPLCIAYGVAGGGIGQ